MENLDSSLYLTFTVSGQTYGVPIHSVIEINREFGVTPIPQTPDYVLGFVNLRGKVIPIIDLKRRFGLGSAEQLKESCIIVIRGINGAMGVWVDSVCEVIDFPKESVNSAPNIGAADNEGVIKGMTRLKDEAVVLLDLSGILKEDLKIEIPSSEAA